RPRCRGGPSPGALAPRPPRLAAPDGDHAQGAPVVCGGGAAWLWRVVWRVVCVGTWCAPVLLESLCWVKYAQAHVTRTPLRLWKRSYCGVTRSEDFLLSFVTLM